MMCLAQLACPQPDSAPSYEAEQQRQQIDLYREKTVQCLVMGDYTNCGPHVLETVQNYVYVEFGIRPDADKDVGLLLALEVKLAVRMGYHRDPGHFGGISPFQGEMRRRMWASVLLGDVLISSQMGMPCTIAGGQWDTAEPRNLNDDDFGADVQELPPSRPDTEFTTALGSIVRRRIVTVLGEIAALTASVKPADYSEVMRLDRRLTDAETRIPPLLRVKEMAASATDSPQVIMARMFIAHLVYKGRIMLHRRFLHARPSSCDDGASCYSLKSCIDASLGSLHLQQVLEDETAPGGRLHVLRWRVTSSMNHQFLTATMVLCSLLHRKSVLNREEEVTAALHGAGSIWVRRSPISREAGKAARAVSMVLEGAGVDFNILQCPGEYEIGGRSLERLIRHPPSRRGCNWAGLEKLWEEGNDIFQLHTCIQVRSLLTSN